MNALVQNTPLPRWLSQVRAHLRTEPYPLLAILLAIPAMLPLLAPGYFFQAHDARHSVFFLVMFDRVFSEGTVWPIWSPDQAAGFGYPLWLLYAPLAYFLGEAFHLIGFSFTEATKVVWATGFVLGALGMYRLARRWWTGPIALVASLAFTYAPYHLSQIYVRGALAEFMALNWFPWVVIAFLALWEAPGTRRVAVAALAGAVLLLTHTHSLLMLAPLLAAMVAALWLPNLLRDRKQAGSGRGPALRPLIWLGAAVTLGLLLSAIFLVPMLLERQYVAQEQWTYGTYDYALHFVYPSQFFDGDWGYLYSTPGAADGMSFQVGLVIALFAFIGALAVLKGRGLGRAPRLVFLFLLAGSLAAVFVMLPPSIFLWKALPLVALIQFPWRLLAVLAFSMALLAGAGASFLTTRMGDEERSTGYALILALVLIVASLPFLHPPLEPVRPEDEGPLAPILFELEHPDMRGMMRWSERLPANEDSPLFAQYLAGEPLQRAAIAEGAGEIIEQSAGATTVRALVRSAGPVRLRFYTYFFPGWYVTVDGVRTEIAPDPPNGLIGVDLPEGEHEVVLRFGSTAPRTIGALLSAAALLIIIVILLARPGRAH